MFYASLVTWLVSRTSLAIWFTINSHNYGLPFGLKCRSGDIHIDNTTCLWLRLSFSCICAFIRTCTFEIWNSLITTCSSHALLNYVILYWWVAQWSFECLFNSLSCECCCSPLLSSLGHWWVSSCHACKILWESYIISDFLGMLHHIHSFMCSLQILSVDKIYNAVAIKRRSSLMSINLHFKDYGQHSGCG